MLTFHLSVLSHHISERVAADLPAVRSGAARVAGLVSAAGAGGITFAVYRNQRSVLQTAVRSERAGGALCQGSPAARFGVFGAVADRGQAAIAPGRPSAAPASRAPVSSTPRPASSNPRLALQRPAGVGGAAEEAARAAVGAALSRQPPMMLTCRTI